MKLFEEYLTEDAFAKTFDGVLTKKQVQVLAKHAVEHKINLNKCKFEKKLPKDIIVAPRYDSRIPVLNMDKYDEMIENNDIVIIKLQKTADVKFDTIVYFFEDAFYEKNGVFKEMDTSGNQAGLDYTLIFRNYDSKSNVEWIEMFMGLITEIRICKNAVVSKALVDKKVKKYFNGNYDTNLSIKENIKKQYEPVVKDWFEKTLKSVSFEECLSNKYSNLSKLDDFINNYKQLIANAESSDTEGKSDWELDWIKSGIEKIEKIMKK